MQIDELVGPTVGALLERVYVVSGIQDRYFWTRPKWRKDERKHSVKRRYL